MDDSTDPVDLVRDARHRISERFDHDAAKVVEYYLTLQEEFRGRLVDARAEAAPDARRGDAKGDATDAIDRPDLGGEL